MIIVEIETNARGVRVGASHNFTKWPRATVDRALALRAAGHMYRTIRDELGVPIATLHSWCTGLRRRPPDRVIVKRVKERESLVCNQQRPTAYNAYQPCFSDETDEGVNAPAASVPSKIPSEGDD